MSIRHVVKTVTVSGAATVCAAVFALGFGAGVAGASTLTSPDGNTTLTTQGTVSAGTPYSGGQTITVGAIANSTLNNSNEVSNGVPGQTTGAPTGNYTLEECVDPGGLVANLPTQASNCEAATRDVTQSKTLDGSFTDSTFQVFDLPDANLGVPTMTGSCGVAPNFCVIGIFSTDPQNGNGFKFPRLFSAPFQIQPDPTGLDSGNNPGDGTPEVPLAIGLPLGALAVFGGWTIRNRRRQRRAA
jgi:hypothetical protein